MAKGKKKLGISVFHMAHSHIWVSCLETGPRPENGYSSQLGTEICPFSMQCELCMVQM